MKRLSFLVLAAVCLLNSVVAYASPDGGGSGNTTVIENQNINQTFDNSNNTTNKGGEGGNASATATGGNAKAKANADADASATSSGGKTYFFGGFSPSTSTPGAPGTAACPMYVGTGHSSSIHVLFAGVGHARSNVQRDEVCACWYATSRMRIALAISDDQTERIEKMVWPVVEQCLVKEGLAKSVQRSPVCADVEEYFADPPYIRYVRKCDISGPPTVAFVPPIRPRMVVEETVVPPYVEPAAGPLIVRVPTAKPTLPPKESQQPAPSPALRLWTPQCPVCVPPKK